MTNPLSKYDREALTALYASLDYMQCNDLPTDAVENAIAKIESKIVEATKSLLAREKKPTISDDDFSSFQKLIGAKRKTGGTKINF